MDVYLELDPRSTLPAGSRLATTYRGRTVHVDYRGNHDQCGRCGWSADAHAWRVYDLTNHNLVASQGGVLDCGILGDES